MNPEAQRWNERYIIESQRYLRQQPRDFLVDHKHLLSDQGIALDAASGVATNGLYLAERGWRVIALDISDVALQLAQQRFKARRLSFNGAVMDFGHLWLPGEYFDVILNIKFLERSTFPIYRKALKPGGLLFFEGFLKSDDQIKNPEFYLSPGELREAFKDFAVIYSNVIEIRDEDDSLVKTFEQLVARKPFVTQQ
jgi:hypothetical protein